MTAARRLALLAAFALPAIVYFASASPEPASWDTAELQGVPYILGISHPTGFPFYVLVGYVWSHAVAFGTVAWRMNAMSGVAIATAAAAAYALALEFGASIPVALFATFWFAFTQNVWAHAARAEAQDLAVACCALAIYAFTRWLRGAADVWFAAAFALCGLGIAAHPNALWILPALVIGAIVAKRRPRMRVVAVSAATRRRVPRALSLSSASLGVRCRESSRSGRDAARRRRRHLLELQRSANVARAGSRANGQRIRRPLVLPRVVQSGSSRAGAVGVRQHLAPAVRRVGDVPRSSAASSLLGAATGGRRSSSASHAPPGYSSRSSIQTRATWDATGCSRRGLPSRFSARSHRFKAPARTRLARSADRLSCSWREPCV